MPACSTATGAAHAARASASTSPNRARTGAFMARSLRSPGVGSPERTSHPEHGPARILRRRVERRGEREADDVARLRGFDDAVVPEARGRVVGAALALVLLEDRPLELGLLVRGHRLALGLERLELHL